jgi:cob(I)alamin adenosyltransferase
MSKLPIKIERFKNQIHPLFLKEKKINKNLLKKSIEESLSKIENYIENKKFDIIILDEILNAVNQKFCSKSLLKKLIKKSTSVELILTGRSAPPDLIKISDYVSFVKNIKHPFCKNIFARKGIEY